jgi:hypothetical protein
MLQPIHPQRNSHPYPLARRVGGLRVGLDMEKRKFLTLL